MQKTLFFTKKLFPVDRNLENIEKTDYIPASLDMNKTEKFFMTKENYMIKRDFPASDWIQCFPIGSGRLAGSITTGDIATDHIFLNHERLWTHQLADKICPQASIAVSVFPMIFSVTESATRLHLPTFSGSASVQDLTLKKEGL